MEELGIATHHHRSHSDPVIKPSGQIVAVVFDGNIYPGEIVNSSEERVYISAMGKVSSRGSV
jgi:hypothetical protein